MLLDETPAVLIKHTIENFNIIPDKNALGRVSESISALRQARDLRLRDAESALKKLSRTQQSLASSLAANSSTESPPTSSNGKSSHSSTILSLDSQKFRLAKQSSSLEAETARLQTQLSQLETKLADLDSQGVEGDERMRTERAMGDGTVLKLRVYRSLGFELEAVKNDGTGVKKEDGEMSVDSAAQAHQNQGIMGYARVLVRSFEKGIGDVHIVNLDPKFSRFFYAGYLWGCL